MQTRDLSCFVWVALGVSIVGCADDVRRSPGGDLDGGPFDASADAAPRDAGPRPDVPAVDAGACTDTVDVVFAIDVSSTMSFVLDTLRDEVGAVVDAAGTLAPDPHFGIVGFADNHALALGGALEGGRVHTDASTLQSAFRDLQMTYTNWNRNPGDGPGGPDTQNPICEENSLDALYASAAEFPWRENATRVVIVATDDTFLEAPDNYGDRDGDGDTTSSDYPREGDYPAEHTIEDVVSALRDQRVRVFSFTRLEPPSVLNVTSRCGTGRRRDWDDVSAGWSQPYDGQPPIPTQTDGQNFDIEEVRRGRLSLTATIEQVVLESYCVPPLY